MRRTASYMVTVMTLITAAAGAGGEERRVFTTPLKGVVTSGRAFAYLDELPGSLHLLHAPLSGGPARDGPDCALVSEPPSVWQVAYGYFWVSSNFSVPNFAMLDKLHRYRLNDLLDGKLIPGPGAAQGEAASFIESDPFGPLDQARMLRMDVDYKYHLFFDCLPTAEDEVLLFQLRNAAGADWPSGKPGAPGAGTAARPPGPKKEDYEEPHWSLAVFRFKNKWDDKKKEFQGETWSRVEGIEVGFRERFRVLGKGDDYYFVTDSGKLYRSPPARPERGKGRTMETVWDDKKQPIVSFITDADAERTFLFCKPDKDGKGVYFEMSDKPDPQPYDAGKIPEAKVADQLPAVLGYAKILLADKKIKDKE